MRARFPTGTILEHHIWGLALRESLQQTLFDLLKRLLELHLL
jgi:hypothetical protein